MGLDEFTDRLFDILNETDHIPVADITVSDSKKEIRMLLKDHTIFTVKCSSSGTWFLMEKNSPR